jgi:hypothetical protein
MKGVLRELGPLRALLAALFLALGMILIWAAGWTIINGLSARQDRSDVANSLEVLAPLEATGEREVVRRRVRRLEKFADVAWRDASGSVRRARIAAQPDAFVKQGPNWFVRIRYFEHDPSRLPIARDGGHILSRADVAEASAINGSIVTILTIVGMIGVFAAMRKSRGSNPAA